MRSMGQSAPFYRTPWAEQQAHDNGYMREMQMQRASFGNNKKRPIDSDLEFQPPKQMQQASFGNNKKRPFNSNLDFQPLKRQRMGLSYEQFSPMGASSARMQSLLAQSWQ